MTGLERDGLRRYLHTFDSEDDDVLLCQQCGRAVRAVWDDEANQYVVWKHTALYDDFKICEGGGKVVKRDDELP